MKSVFKKRVFSTSYRVYRLIKLTEIINDISMFNSSVDHVTYGLNFVSRKKEKKREEGGGTLLCHISSTLYLENNHCLSTSTTMTISDWYHWHYVLRTWPKVIQCLYVADLYQILFMVLLVHKLKFINCVSA